METLEDILAEVLQHDQPLQDYILKRARAIARKVLHPCKHMTMGPCSLPHSSEDTMPGWIDAVPLRYRWKGGRQ